MNSQRILPPVVYIVALTVCYLWMSQAVPSLPARMATHFDAAGSPDGWMTREHFRVFSLYFTTGLSLLVPLLMTLLRVVPARYLNVPRADYWRQPEPFARARAFLYGWAWWYGTWSVGFSAGLFALVRAANTAEPPALNGVHLALLTGAYLFGTALWVLRIVWYFVNDGGGGNLKPET